MHFGALSNNFINLNFDIVVEPSSIEKEPPFELHDGVNYVNGDDSKIYLQLNAHPYDQLGRSPQLTSHSTEEDPPEEIHGR